MQVYHRGNDKMAKTAMARRRKQSNFISFALVAIVVLLIAFIIFLKSIEIKSKLSAYTSREEALDSQIAEEEERSLDIDELEKYVQTKAYAGEQAQEKLGLVSEGEIVFRQR